MKKLSLYLEGILDDDFGTEASEQAKKIAPEIEEFNKVFDVVKKYIEKTYKVGFISRDDMRKKA